MKWAYLLSVTTAILSVLLFRANRQAEEYREVLRYQAGRLASLRAEHQYFLLPSIGMPIERPMVVSEAGVIDSVPDGIYVRAVSTCAPCQWLHDSLEVAGIKATFLMEESRDMLAKTVAGTDARLPMLTGVSGSFLNRLPNTGTPGIGVVRQGRIVAFETGVLPVAELRKLATVVQ